jgi:hypothetical protein
MMAGADPRTLSATEIEALTRLMRS